MANSKQKERINRSAISIGGKKRRASGGGKSATNRNIESLPDRVDPKASRLARQKVLADLRLRDPASQGNPNYLTNLHSIPLSHRTPEERDAINRDQRDFQTRINPSLRDKEAIASKAATSFNLKKQAAKGRRGSKRKISIGGRNRAINIGV